VLDGMCRQCTVESRQDIGGSTNKCASYRKVHPLAVRGVEATAKRTRTRGIYYVEGGSYDGVVALHLLRGVLTRMNYLIWGTLYLIETVNGSHPTGSSRRTCANTHIFVIDAQGLAMLVEIKSIAH